MPIDLTDPLPWVQYERSTRRLWECVASRANQTLGNPKRRVRVLPGASALADLVGELWRGSVPGLTHLTPSARVRLLFRDDVHMSALGTYFMGLVHYAVLFGQSPHGALGQAGLEVETAAHFQGLASRHAVSYGRLVDAAVTRDMPSCRAIATESCAELHGFMAGSKPWSAVKQKAQAFLCARRYGDAKSPANPFRD